MKEQDYGYKDVRPWSIHQAVEGIGGAIDGSGYCLPKNDG